MIQNKYSEKGYRDVVLNTSGLDGANVSGSIANISVPSQKLSSYVQFAFFLFRLTLLSLQ